MNKKDLIEVWRKYTENNDVKLNPEEHHVERIAEGVLENEKKCSLKLCPCRIRDGTRERDLELICPCNFKTHDTWRSEGRCWCGLFMKK